MGNFKFKSLRASQEISSLKLQTLFDELSCHLGANWSILPKFHQILGFQEEIPANFYQIETLEVSLIFSSKSISNMKKFL
jgi:hypothetical protein